MDMLASMWLMAAVAFDFVFPGSRQSVREPQRRDEPVRLPAHWRRW